MNGAEKVESIVDSMQTTALINCCGVCASRLDDRATYVQVWVKTQTRQTRVIGRLLPLGAFTGGDHVIFVCLLIT